MNVKHYQDDPVDTDTHRTSIIRWATQEAKFLGYQNEIYTYQGFLQTGVFEEIMWGIDDQYFSNDSNAHGEIAGIYNIIEDFLAKECGQKVKLAIKNSILSEKPLDILFKLLLYCCLHSKKREEYIGRVVLLEGYVQVNLMSAVEEVNTYLMNLLNQNDVLSRVEELEIEVELLKGELTLSGSREEGLKRLNEELEDELSRNNKELEKYKREREKAMEILELSSFEEYLSTFQRIQQENVILTKYVEELEDLNNQYENNEKEFRKDIDGQSEIIVDLNEHITSLKDKINGLRLENSISMRGSYEEHSNDVNRSFNNHMISSLKENCDDKKKSKWRHAFSCIDDLENVVEESENLKKSQINSEEMFQLRKYNSDLIHKIETTYKALNTMTHETTQFKEKNDKLQKENKFYKKQIRELRKLHERMEKDLLMGRI